MKMSKEFRTVNEHYCLIVKKKKRKKLYAMTEKYIEFLKKKTKIKKEYLKSKNRLLIILEIWENTYKYNNNRFTTLVNWKNKHKELNELINKVYYLKRKLGKLIWSHGAQ